MGLNGVQVNGKSNNGSDSKGKTLKDFLRIGYKKVAGNEYTEAAFKAWSDYLLAKIENAKKSTEYRNQKPVLESIQ